MDLHCSISINLIECFVKMHFNRIGNQKFVAGFNVYIIVKFKWILPLWRFLNPMLAVADFQCRTDGWCRPENNRCLCILGSVKAFNMIKIILLTRFVSSVAYRRKSFHLPSRLCHWYISMHAEKKLYASERILPLNVVVIVVVVSSFHF